MTLWPGECHVHAGIRFEHVERCRAEHPEAELLIHPECSCLPQVLEQVDTGALPESRVRVASTGGMLERVREEPFGTFIIATETGMLHPLGKAAPRARLIAVNRMAVCKYMKAITLPKLRDSLKRMRFEVRVPEEIAERARTPIERMVAIG